MPAMKEPSPILVSHLFAPLLEGLLALLSDLSAEEWKKPTVCEGWTVKDVALHLLGVEIGNLSRKRDGFSPSSPPIDSARELVALVNDLNAAWVQISRRISPRLLCDLLGFTGRQVCEYFQSLDPYQVGNPVSWAGPDPAPVWLDMAREYTERWHHQQHIRDAVDQPGLKEPRYLRPVLETFVWALPHAFRQASGPDGTSVTLSIEGDSGGQWTLLRDEGAWRFYRGELEEPGTEIIMDQEFAWRFFTRGIGIAAAREHVRIRGDENLAEPVFEMVSIIA